MTRRLVIECGCAETRAALLIYDVVWKCWFGAARGDEPADSVPTAGRRFAGRVKKIDKSLGAAFIDIGTTQDGFLPLKKDAAEHCVEGAMLEVFVKSPPRQGKGALLRFVGGVEKATRPGRMAPIADAVTEAVAAIGDDVDEIVIDDGRAAKFLSASVSTPVVHEARPRSLFEFTGADEVVSEALQRSVALAGGGQITIDETQALTAIDVDTCAQDAASSARLREKIAFAAADEIVHQLSLRNIGGHIVIDFPPINSDSARKRFADHLRKRIKSLDGATSPAFSKSGLYSLILPRRGLSLQEQFCEPSVCDPAPGWRFTVETMTKRALCALERRLRSAPALRYKLSVGRDIAQCLTAHPEWRERLDANFGARFTIAELETGEGRDYDLSEQ